MNIKKQLLAQINKKAAKIEEKRVEAASNKTVEAACFEFFNNIEESRLLHGGNKYDVTLFTQAKSALEKRLRGIDNRLKISVEFNASEDLSSWEEPLVRGVTIWWSDTYIAKHNIDPSMYIDVSQVLLF